MKQLEYLKFPWIIPKVPDKNMELILRDALIKLNEGKDVAIIGFQGLNQLDYFSKLADKIINHLRFNEDGSCYEIYKGMEIPRKHACKYFKKTLDEFNLTYTLEKIDEEKFSFRKLTGIPVSKINDKDYE